MAAAPVLATPVLPALAIAPLLAQFVEGFVGEVALALDHLLQRLQRPLAAAMLLLLLPGLEVLVDLGGDGRDPDEVPPMGLRVELLEAAQHRDV